MTSSPNINYNEIDNDIPLWLFEVEEDDDINEQTALLEELDIDISQILQSLLWMLNGPILRIIKGRSTDISSKNPLLAVHKSTIDFWGPCMCICFYSTMLWISNVKDGTWAFIIWTFTSIFNHLVMRTYTKSTLLLHMAILGYSITPWLPFAGIILLAHPPIWLSRIFECFALIYTCIACILAYLSVVITSNDVKHRLFLLFPPIILMHLYFIALVPIRFYTYNNNLDDTLNIPNISLGSLTLSLGLPTGSTNINGDFNVTVTDDKAVLEDV